MTTVVPKPFKFTLGAFPGCCGIMILYGMNHHISELRSKLEPEETAGILEAFKNQAKYPSVGMVLLALNNNQMKQGMGALALEAGFKDLTGPFFHPGHGHRITIFAYEQHPHKREVPPPMPKEIVVEEKKTPITAPAIKRSGFFTTASGAPCPKRRVVRRVARPITTQSSDW